MAIRGLVLTLYARFLRMALRHRFAVIFSAFAFLILLIQIWLLTVGLETPVEFFPTIDPKTMYVNIDTALRLKAAGDGCAA